MDEDLHPVLRLVISLLALGVGVFSLWCTVIAFVGGTMPILGWEVEGGVGPGLLWLFIIDPIVITVGYWLSMIIILPLGAMFRKK